MNISLISGCIISPTISFNNRCVLFFLRSPVDDTNLLSLRFNSINSFKSMKHGYEYSVIDSEKCQIIIMIIFISLNSITTIRDWKPHNLAICQLSQLKPSQTRITSFIAYLVEAYFGRVESKRIDRIV